RRRCSWRPATASPSSSRRSGRYRWHSAPDAAMRALPPLTTRRQDENAYAISRSRSSLRLAAGHLEHLEHRLAVRNAEAGAGVPAGPRRVTDVADLVVALGDRPAGSRIPIEDGVNEAYVPATCLVDQSKHPGQQWRNRTGSSNRSPDAADHDAIAALRIGVAGKIGHASPDLSVIDRLRHAGLRLVGRKRKDIADAAAGTGAPVVPHFLARNVTGSRGDHRAAAANDVRAGRGKIRV